MGEFAKQAAKFNIDLGALFNRAIRVALLSGLAMAVRTTNHDSSNAAVHWMIASVRRSRPESRKFGKLRDLRQTARESNPPVGSRRSYGKNRALTERFVRDREIKDVLDKMVVGRKPESIFYFFNALDPNWRYGVNANIDAAGRAALEEVKRVYDRRIAAGNSRKNPL